VHFVFVFVIDSSVRVPSFPPVAVQCVVGLHWGRWVQLERGVVLVNDQHESWSGCVRQPSGWHLHEHEHAAITGAWNTGVSARYLLLQNRRHTGWSVGDGDRLTAWCGYHWVVVSWDLLVRACTLIWPVVDKAAEPLVVCSQWYMHRD
jgi:hypothetical protein